MHYRITSMKFNPDNRAEFLAYADSVREEMSAIAGVQFIETVELGEGEATVLAKYDTKANADAAVPTVQRIMGGMASYFTAPPVQKDGGVMWKM